MNKKIALVLLLILIACSSPQLQPLATTTVRTGIPQVSVYKCVPADMGQFDLFIGSFGSMAECAPKIGLVPSKDLYLNGDRFYGAQGLVTITQQKTLCSSTQRAHDPVSDNNVTQGAGEFCAIHDAIINKTSVNGLYPTESFFLHKPNGDRYCASSGTSCMYRPNPADPVWRQYFANASKKLISSSGADGLFIDNLNASFTQIINEGGGAPKELANNDLYDAAMVGFVSVVRSTLGNASITGNLNDMSYTPIWDAMAPYLSGGMTESWGNTWSGGKPNILEVERDLNFAESWLVSGKTLQIVYSCGSPTNCTTDLQRYGVGLYYLIAHRGSGATYFAGMNGAYSSYTSVPEYYIDMGQPIETRRKIGSVYERCFMRGSVRVDLSARTATFGGPCAAPATVTPTSTWVVVTIVTDTPPVPKTVTATPAPVTITPSPRPTVCVPSYDICIVDMP